MEPRAFFKGRLRQRCSSHQPCIVTRRRRCRHSRIAGKTQHAAEDFSNVRNHAAARGGFAWRWKISRRVPPGRCSGSDGPASGSAVWPTMASSHRTLAEVFRLLVQSTSGSWSVAYLQLLPNEWRKAQFGIGGASRPPTAKMAAEVLLRSRAQEERSAGWSPGCPHAKLNCPP